MLTITRFGSLNVALTAVLWIGAATTAVPAQTEDERIVAALGLREGMRVADVGAGDGRFTTGLAERVGVKGHVFATEVDEAELAKVRSRVADAGLTNVTTVLGDQKATGLQTTCCDAILLRLVYHHFADPEVMRRDLWRALRPGGRIVVIEVPPKPNWRRLEGVPERGGHGIEEKDLLADMRSTGFAVAERHESWPAEDGAYCVVFERPVPSPTGLPRRTSRSSGTTAFAIQRDAP
jgi:SAM-dependent methyltransferase